MDIQTVRNMILRAKGERSWRAFAEAVGEDHGYLYRMALGERDPSDTVLNKLGLERVTVYRKKTSKADADSC